MTAVIKKIKETDYNRPKILVWLAVFASVLILLHLYLFISMASNLITLKESGAKLEKVTEEYQELEGQYLKAVSGLGIEDAYSLGFVDQSAKDVSTVEIGAFAKR